MLRSPPLRSLLSSLILRVVVPLSLVLFGVIIASLVAYQRTLTSLLVNRDQQLAALAVERVSEAMDGYARMLDAVTTASDWRTPSVAGWTSGLTRAQASLRVFNAGVAAVDANGRLLVANPPDILLIESTVADQDYFQQVRDQLQPAFSSVINRGGDGRNMVIIAVPVLSDQHTFLGALLGGIFLDDSKLESSVSQLTIGDQGFAFVVDRHGRVLFHANAQTIGLDFTDQPFVKDVMAGQSGGTLWREAGGEEFVIGYAPIPSTGWGLIVREPWSAVSAPARLYGAGTVAASVVAVALAAFFLWSGLRLITMPVRRLVEQTSQLASGDTVEPLAGSRLQEIDALSRNFNMMAAKVAAYRAGLRRYVGAITQSQEDERRRLSRDLHDETAQSLLAMVRRLELYQASEQDPERLKQLADLQVMVTDTLRGVRLISKDLRPLVLDDLGLIPALRALVQAAHEGVGAVPQADLNVVGEPAPLTPKQELSLYRIVQEALTNIRKHAHATGVRVDLSFQPDNVQLEVVDDGQGFEVPDSLMALAQGSHFGLLGMQERAWAAGASLSIKSTPGHGARLQVVMPRHPGWTEVDAEKDPG